MADRVLRAAVGETDVLKADVAGERGGLADAGVAHALGVHYLSDASGGDARVGEHDDGEGSHDHAVHDHGHILRDGENIARAHAARSVHHLQAAEIDDQNDGHIQKEGRDGQQCSHGDVAADDIFRHDARCIRDALMLVRFGIEGADDADAAQAFAHDAVLLVDVQVGFFPQGQHLLACQPAAQQDHRDKGKQNERQLDVLAHRQHDAADKEHGNGRHGAAEHGGDP